MASDMEPFFDPRSVAVAGASRSAPKLGNVILANLLRFGFRGGIYPIHPAGGEIMGLAAYPSLAQVPDRVATAVAVLPREGILDFVRQCGEAGVGHIVVCAAGFADDGPEGAAMQRRLEEAVKGYGMRMMGPNSVGTISTRSGFVTSIMTLDPLREGGISIVAQTGLFAGGFARWMSSDQLFGVSRIACLGNKADVDELDMLAYLENDDSTRVVAVYTEGLRDGRGFLDLAARVSRRKPIVLLKGGRTEAGARMAAGHTGSLAGEEAVYRGALAQAGVVPVDCIDSLFDCAKVLDYCPLPEGNGLGVVSITGSGTVLAADACQRRGVALPPLREATLAGIRKGVPEWAAMGNPADIWSATLDKGVEDAYRAILFPLAAQEDVHMLLVVFSLVPEAEFDAAGMLREVRERHPDKPVLACVMGASHSDRDPWFRGVEAEGTPVFDSVERGVDAAWALARYAGWLKRPQA